MTGPNVILGPRWRKRNQCIMNLQQSTSISGRGRHPPLRGGINRPALQGGIRRVGMSSQTLRTVEVIAGFLLVWEAACRLFDLPTYFLPAPSLILAEIWSEPRWYLAHCSYTLFTTALGFGLALLVGVIAAVGITYSKLLENTLFTLLVSLNSVPKIALA